MKRNKWYCVKTKEMTLKQVKTLIERDGFNPHWINIYNLAGNELPYNCDFVKALDNLKVAFFQIENYEDDAEFDFLVIKFEPIAFINYTEV